MIQDNYKLFVLNDGSSYMCIKSALFNKDMLVWIYFNSPQMREYYDQRSVLHSTRIEKILESLYDCMYMHVHKLGIYKLLDVSGIGNRSQA